MLKMILVRNFNISAGESRSSSLKEQITRQFWVSYKLQVLASSISPIEAGGLHTMEGSSLKKSVNGNCKFVLVDWDESHPISSTLFSCIDGSQILYCGLWYWCLLHTGVLRILKAICNFCICLWIIVQKNFLSYLHAGVGTTDSALDEDGVLEIDTTISLETTWRAMEDLVSKGLVRSIGIRCTDILKF